MYAIEFETHIENGIVHVPENIHHYNLWMQELSY